ncbi:predicted protein [Naegleria gruberi]|uniref:Predicted protein n=1 Tax=Naegleria gruberi TaxID=5762 RepID=D2VJV6_NAEGR|nr:uncharacterized protein NAEGRDRAFT_69176 [Naegleria gruberi]EFC42756.1 predicted protein [Naegleria gruberi]|eukprot:XP_002675500.1 predicted protein [Naegleria gruberi strain NEG-M]
MRNNLNPSVTTILMLLMVMMIKLAEATTPIFEPSIDTTPRNLAPNTPILYNFEGWNFNIQFSTLPDSIVSGSLKMSAADVPITHTIPSFNKKMEEVFFFTLDLTQTTLNYPPNTPEEEKARMRATRTAMEVVFTTSVPSPFMYDPYSYKMLRYDEATNAFSEPVDALKIDLDYSFSINEAFGKKIIFGLFVFKSPLDVQFGKKIAIYYPSYLQFSYDDYLMGYLFPKANYFTPSNPSMLTVNQVKQKYEKLGTSRVLLSRISVTITKNPLQFEEATFQALSFKNENVKNVVGDSYRIDLNSLTCIFLSGNQELMARKVSFENNVLTCDVNPLLAGDHEVLIVANNANPPEPMNRGVGSVVLGLFISVVAIVSLVVLGIGVFMFIKRSKMSRGLLSSSQAAPTSAYYSTDI